MIKVKKRKILLLPGDGIGPEVISEVKKIIEWFNKNKSLDFEIEEGLVGGASYEKYKSPITDEVKDHKRSSGTEHSQKSKRSNGSAYDKYNLAEEEPTTSLLKKK